ncbi:MAG TPA: polysaccharide deacetylase family protein [Gammaproteobacteria bacterium]|nr:polysaccharide deacetylase family protein [Gammaproteobacteria bacterium]
MYHRFSEDPRAGHVHRAEFKRQVDYLSRHFNVMRMDQVLEAITNHPADLKNAAVITVDDGYLDFYEIAFPVLREAGLPATLFLTTRFVDGDFWLWPDQLRYILEHSEFIEPLTIPGLELHAGSRLDTNLRSRLWDDIVDYLLGIEDAAKQVWLESFRTRQKVELPATPPACFRGVSWEQVREMATANIEMGAHTRTHPSLGRVTEEQLHDEVTGAVIDIERQTGRRPASFCFPNGQPGDYNENVKMHVRQAGCKGAVTAFYDSRVADDPYEVRRFTASERRFQFEKSANGIELLAARWFRSSNKSAVGGC